MDELGIATLTLVASDVHHHGTAFDVSTVTARWEEAEELARRFPGRFVALWGIEPQRGLAGVRRADEALAQPWVVGAYLHTHSFDRPFDHADLYPFYALCARHGVPMMMQAGTSGGRMPSECGKPIGIDRPAIYFPDVPFVLSHTGWPWVTEAVAMALKFSNVYLGTGSYPPAHWPGELVEFLADPDGARCCSPPISPLSAIATRWRSSMTSGCPTTCAPCCSRTTPAPSSPACHDRRRVGRSPP